MAINKKIETKVKVNNTIYEFNIDANKPILYSLLENNVNIDFSCQKGSCKRCKAVLLDGAVVSVQKNNLNNHFKNYILTCISKPNSDKIFLEIPKDDTVLVKFFNYIIRNFKRMICTV